jgi:hypothetical protein
MRITLRLSAAYLCLMGLAALLLPGPASSSLQQPMSNFDLFATRTVGAILISLAMVDWFAAPSTGVLAANAFLNTALATIDMLAIAQGTIGASSWPGVVIHAAFLTLVITVLVHHRRTARHPVLRH